MGSRPRAEHRRRNRATAAEVAALAGVSPSAVSRTFREGSVSNKVRKRVHAAADQLGYRPNAIAQALLSRRTNVIAILMTASTNRHYPEVLPALVHATTARGSQVMLFAVDDETTVSTAVDNVLAYQVDAAVALVDIPAVDAARLQRERVPLVLYNRSVAPYPATIVSCDHRSAGQALVRHLIEAGHHDFGLIDGPESSTLAVERAAGVVAELSRPGHSAATLTRVSGDFSYESALAATATLLDLSPRPTALIAVNDIMAMAAVDAARLRGLRVPQDVAIAGFDGIEAAGWAPYRITTMRQPLRNLADAAVDAAMLLIDDSSAPVEQRVFACQLDIGSST